MGGWICSKGNWGRACDGTARRVYQPAAAGSRCPPTLAMQAERLLLLGMHARYPAPPSGATSAAQRHSLGRCDAFAARRPFSQYHTIRKIVWINEDGRGEQIANLGAAPPMRHATH